MKYIQLFILYFLTITYSTSAQIKYPGSFEDDFIPGDISARISALKSTTASLYTPYGLSFTPKGEFKVLIICAGFGEPYDNYLVGGWESGTNTLPLWANGKSTFYSDNSDFLVPATNSDSKNISRYYYEMSGGTFKMTADVYPKRININATGASSFADLNRRVIEKMKVEDPYFNWGKYDSKKNNPNYLSDNSQLDSDSKIDFVVIVYRYKREVSNANSPWYTAPPVIGMHSWTGATGGYAAINGLSGITCNGYSFGYYNGYTHCLGSASMYDLFIHEVAHTLFDCPHYASANGVVGNYFYSQIGGWGMMRLGSGPFGCANGWERWYLGWIELTANNANSDIKSSIDLPNNGEFTLRDFITTGDVIRIKIRNDGGVSQYLWLENHQGNSIYDDRNWATTDGCNAFPSSARGLVAYIESIADDKSNPFDFWTDTYTANGIKPLHSHGNFDFSYSGPLSTQCLWGNSVYNIIEGEPNPISGQNKIEGLRFDLNEDGQIFNNNYINNSTLKNESHWVAKRNGLMTYDFMGGDINFTVGRTIGMSTNPALTNRPTLINTSDAIKETLTPIYLNGISVNVYSQEANGDIKVRISYNDVAIKCNLRWTGHIVLPDITENSTPDLILNSDKTLTINKSGTPNRHSKHPYFNDFVNPSTFTCSQNSFFLMQNKSKVIVDNYSTLFLESSSTLEISDGAVLTIKSGSSFQIKSGANLNIRGTGKVEIESGAYFCIETGANINLLDDFSVINLRKGYNNGLNPTLFSSSPTCSSEPEMHPTSGIGSINTYNSNLYLQNQVFTICTYLTGLNIFAGTAVTTTIQEGSVVIQRGANVIFDSDGEVSLEEGFEVQLGGEFEIK